jgi:hypothetical protein
MRCYKDQYFCSYSMKCSNDSCKHWIDLNIDTSKLLEPLCLRNFKTNKCGHKPLEDSKDVRT